MSEFKDHWPELKLTDTELQFVHDQINQGDQKPDRIFIPIVIRDPWGQIIVTRNQVRRFSEEAITAMPDNL